MRQVRAILACAATLTLAAGCGIADRAGSRDPSEALAEAAARLKDTTFEFGYDDHGALTVDGSYDPARRQGEYTSTQVWIEPGMAAHTENEFKTVSRLVEGTRYQAGWFTVRFGEKRPEPADQVSWCRTPLPTDGNPYLEESFNPAEIPQTLREATEVRRSDDGTIFTGRVDAAGVSSLRPLTKPDDQGTLPVRTVHFEAVVDSEGRLVRYSIDRSELLGTQPGAQLDYTYSGFGVSVEVTAPPAADTAACPPAR